MPTKPFALFCAGALALSAYLGCPSAGRAGPPPARAAHVADRDLYASSASLLADLLKDEKNLSKILIIKHNSRELGDLIKAISRAAADGEKQLQALAQSDPGLNLKALNLPPGEVAARKAMGKAKEHDLLFSSGDNFAFNLLLTQTEALNYGRQLADLTADNAPTDEAARELRGLSATLDGLLRQVIGQIRSLPGK